MEMYFQSAMRKDTAFRLLRAITAAAVGVALLAVAPVSSATASPVPDESTVSISCQEADGIFLVNWATARAKVPERYPLLMVDGKAQILVATKHCHVESPEGLFAPVDTQDAKILAYLAPIQPVPPGTEEGFHLYFLADYITPLDGSNQFLKLSKKIGLASVQPKAMSVTITSTSGSGEVIERGWGNGAQGFRWSATYAPPGATFVQVNRFYVAHPNGGQTITDAPQNFVLGGTGTMIIEADPKSVLGDFGTVLTGFAVYIASVTRQAHVFKEPR